MRYAAAILLVGAGLALGASPARAQDELVFKGTLDLEGSCVLRRNARAIEITITGNKVRGTIESRRGRSDGKIDAKMISDEKFRGRVRGIDRRNGRIEGKLEDGRLSGRLSVDDDCKRPEFELASLNAPAQEPEIANKPAEAPAFVPREGPGAPKSLEERRAILDALLDKGLISEAEFRAKLPAEEARVAILNRLFRNGLITQSEYSARLSQ